MVPYDMSNYINGKWPRNPKGQKAEIHDTISVKVSYVIEFFNVFVVSFSKPNNSVIKTTMNAVF